jgi:hypothetical protein
MWIVELFTRELTLDWLWRRLPHFREPFHEILDLAHFTIIINGAVLFIAFPLAPGFFNLLDLVDARGFVTFAISSLAVSLPIWCLTFGVRFRESIRAAIRSPAAGSPDLWDDWLDGPE